ncbi:MAG: hypothetical protein J6Y20_07465 [Lachnospiraceae bacterium]|nr:hypothetical protein [Lachnospiraceae bacterium]
MKKTYQVYCIGTSNKWLEYSREFDTPEQAQKCKRSAENLSLLSIFGSPVSYKIVEHTHA